jgi:hypothetical protein
MRFLKTNNIMIFKKVVKSIKDRDPPMNRTSVSRVVGKTTNIIRKNRRDRKGRGGKRGGRRKMRRIRQRSVRH